MTQSNMFEKLEQINKRYNDLDHELSDPEVFNDQKQLQKLAKEKSDLNDLMTKYNKYKSVAKSLEDTRAMLSDSLDAEMQALARQEVTELEAQLERLSEELKSALLPKDPNDERDIIMEVRAGVGGEEASIFAADLFRMYSRYAQNRGWQVEIINASDAGGIGGFKEVVFEVKGRGAFSRFKYERGVHRVQRVPLTEASGRIHTSTATVAVLPEADDVEVSIKPDDLRIDIFHSSGAGGQNVNKVSTAVRLTHLPTGLVVVCQDERSQMRNRQKAMAVLRARLLEKEQEKQAEDITSQRRAQVGGAERSEKIRTYNFPQDRLTDHRIGLTLHNLPRIMEGDLDGMIDSLATADQAKKLEEQLV
jgi:peptide chain release factor 1